MEFKRYQTELDYSYTLGTFPTIELLRSHSAYVRKIIMHSDAKGEGLEKVIQMANISNIPVETNDKQINSLAKSENIFCVGIFDKYQTGLTNKNHIVLVNPDDAGNLGTIIRSMLAFGLSDLVIISPAVDIFNPKTVRSSMGAIFKVNFQYFAGFEKYKDQYPDRHLFSLMSDGETELPKVKFREPFSLILGNEGEGLPKEFHDFTDSIRIPVTDEVDSLNLGIAASIAMYAASNP